MVLPVRTVSTFFQKLHVTEGTLDGLQGTLANRLPTPTPGWKIFGLARKYLRETKSTF